MNKNIKYIIETIQKFNPVEYQDDEQSPIDYNTILDTLDPIGGFIFLLKSYQWKQKNNEFYIDSNNLNYDIFANIKNVLFKISNEYKQLYPDKNTETSDVYIRENIDRAIRNTYNLSYEMPGSIYELAILSSEIDKDPVQDYKIYSGIIFKLEFNRNYRNFSLCKYYKKIPIYSQSYYNGNLEDGFIKCTSVPKVLMDKIINEFNL